MTESNIIEPKVSNISMFEMIDIFQTGLTDLINGIEKHRDNFNCLFKKSKSVIPNYTRSSIIQDQPQNVANFLEDCKITEDNLASLDEISRKSKNLKDIFENIINIQLEEKSLILNKHQEETSAFKMELQRLKLKEVELKSKLEEMQNKMEIQQEVFNHKVSSMQVEIDAPKNEIQGELNSIADNLKEEKMVKKRMESWFVRRLEALQIQIQDMKEKPDFEKLLKKLDYLKSRKPWNKRNNLQLDEPLFEQKSTHDISGTETPWSHYFCFLSQAASEDNTINQAFIVSGEHSLDLTNGSNVLENDLLDGFAEPEKEVYGDIIKQLNDSNLTISEKEKIFCGLIQPLVDSGLLHVQLEDIMNASKASSGKDSLSLEFKKNEQENIKKRTLIFNQKMKIGELKDSALENVLSPILSSIKNLSDNLEKVLPETHSFLEGVKVSENPDLKLFSDQKNQSDKSGYQKEDDLDKGMSNITLSENNDNQNTQKSLQFLQNLLSSVREKEKQLNNSKDKGLERQGLFETKNNQNASVEKGKNKNGSGSFDVPQKLNSSFVIDDKIEASDSFLVDEDMQDFLQKDQAEFSREPNDKASEQILPTTDAEPLIPSAKSNIMNNMSEKNKMELSTQKSQELTAQRKVINEKTSPESQQSFGKKGTTVPVLDFSKIREKSRPKSSSLQPLPINNGINITIVDSSLNQSTMLDQKLFDDFDEDESENKKTEKPSDKQGLNEDKSTVLSNKTPVKFQNPQLLEDQAESDQKPNISLRKSIEQLPRPPSGPKRNFHAKSRESLLEDQKSNSKDLSKLNESKSAVTSIFQVPHIESSFDSGIQVKNDVRNKSSDYKNCRNSRSFQLHRNVDVPDANEKIGPAARALGFLVGKGTHSRQKTEYSPSPSPMQENQRPRMKQSNTTNSIYTTNNNHLINYQSVLHISTGNQSKERDSSNPPSHESTPNSRAVKQAALKRVLTYEDSKKYPTPQKPIKREFSRRIVPNENMNHLNLKEHGDDSYFEKGTLYNSKLDDRTVSPLKRSINEEKSHNQSQVANYSIQNPAPGHFRMKRFNIKKF